ncbi:MAG: HDOD domain-containing protein [Desulfobacterales bacterium]|jgi:diguanylate cyclase (GGDEF)-like protein|nr:HDOD domain-containing protein [Desulfobacterales bacterium]
MHAHASLKDMPRKIGKLPTLPGVAIRILHAMRRETPNIREISETIASDAPLSAKVLQVVNSSFYGLSNQITSVHQAMMYLGLNTVKNLALGFSLIKNFSDKNKGAFDYVQFWKDSLIGAVAAKLITERTNKKHGENAFFLGLLQDIGMLIMSQSIPEAYGEVLAKAKSNGTLLHDLESASLNFNHMEVGEYVTHGWGLPPAFSGPIGAHHAPERANQPTEDIDLQTKILHLSSLYIDLFNNTKHNGSSPYTPIEKMISAYGLAPAVDPFAVTEQILASIKSIFPIFEIQIDEEKYTDIIETARTELSELSTELIDQVHTQSRDLEKIKLQIGLDSMTQLNNHNRFLENLQHEMGRASRYKTPLSIIMGDIDHFKSINDFFGHLAGDHALKCVSAQLKQMLRDSDQIARYGGEEFAIILPMTESDDALKAAERLRKGIESMKVRYNDRPITVTMSFGVAAMESEREVDVEGLIKKADEALYEAKNMGRNKCCYYKKEASQSAKRPSATVMVIDDEEVVLVTVTKMLERLGYAVVVARSGEEAADTFHQQANLIDMVIMDMVMPDIGADQLLGIIRTNRPDTKVILSSGYSLAHIESRNLLQLTDGFLQKPYQLSELSNIVRAAIVS